MFFLFCVANYHNQIIRGHSYIYKVLASERATLEIGIQADGDHWVAQLKLCCNEQPSEETREAVYQWLNDNKRSSEKKNGLSRA